MKFLLTVEVQVRHVRGFVVKRGNLLVQLFDILRSVLYFEDLTDLDS